MKLDFDRTEWNELIENCEFTDEELEVIPFLRRGWTLINIAYELHVSESTLKRRKKKIEYKIIKYFFEGSR